MIYGRPRDSVITMYGTVQYGTYLHMHIIVCIKVDGRDGAARHANGLEARKQIR